MAKKTLTQQMFDKAAETNKLLPEPYEIVFRKHNRGAMYDITIKGYYYKKFSGDKDIHLSWGHMPSDVLRLGMLELENVLNMINKKESK